VARDLIKLHKVAVAARWENLSAPARGQKKRAELRRTV